MHFILLPGSIENAWLLSNNDVQFALIQSDIAGKFKNGTQMFKFPSENMMAIATLFPEVIHLVARRGSGIKTLNDLVGKTLTRSMEDEFSIFCELWFVERQVGRDHELDQASRRMECTWDDAVGAELVSFPDVDDERTLFVDPTFGFLWREVADLCTCGSHHLFHRTNSHAGEASVTSRRPLNT